MRAKNGKWLISSGKPILLIAISTLVVLVSFMASTSIVSATVAPSDRSITITSSKYHFGSGGAVTKGEPFTFEIGKTYPAQYTGYYPAGNAMEGGFNDKKGRKLDPSEPTCASPKEFPYGTKFRISGTGNASRDGTMCVSNDTGGAITVNLDGSIHIDLLFADSTSANNWGNRSGTIEIVSFGDNKTLDFSETVDTRNPWGSTTNGQPAACKDENASWHSAQYPPINRWRHCESPEPDTIEDTSITPNADGYSKPIRYTLEPRLRNCTVNTCHPGDKTAAFDFIVSMGTPVYAIYDGTILDNKPYNVGAASSDPRCKSVQFKGDDGWVYWYGHTYISAKPGTRFKSGDLMGIVGSKACGLGGVPHLHLDRGSPQGRRGGEDAHRDSGIIKLIQDIYANSTSPAVDNTPVATGNIVSPIPDNAKNKVIMSARYGRYPNGGAHWGVDIAGGGDNGWEFVSVCDGVVNSISYGLTPNSNAYRGTSPRTNFVWIKCNDGVCMGYAHWYKYKLRSYIRVGYKISAGTPIAAQGNQGHSTGPHLHFQINPRICGGDGASRTIDPVPYLAKYGVSLPKARY